MRILALDSASTCGSVAVGEGERLLAEIFMGRQETHSRHLMSMVDRALHVAGLTLGRIDGFGITVGPGSFTGLRIGLGTLKGLAVVTGKPVAAVSSLEALAIQCSPSKDLICPMLDARNEEVYAARYRLTGGQPETVADASAVAPEEALGGLEGSACLFVGDGALRYRRLIEEKLGARAAFALPFQHTIRASAIWEISRALLSDGRGVDAAGLVPRYLRKSYAKPPKMQEHI
jgi:tRNA threonylcarbamoyladenosine biosynthesis protein TsaB